MSVRNFQWLKGDKVGKQEIFDKTLRENDVDYIVFKSGNRITTDLLGDFVTEITEGGEQIIDHTLFDPTEIKNPSTENIAPKKKVVKPPVTKTKSDSYSLSDLIKAQLEKNNEFIKINIDIPVLKKELFKMLMDTNPEILDDLTKIVVLKYINKEVIEEDIKKKMMAYYNDDETFEKTDVINIKTEKL